MKDVRSFLQRSIESGEVTVTAEIMPPRGADPSLAIKKANTLRNKVRALNVTDGSRAVMRMSSIALCKIMLDQGLEPILQLACRDRNRIALQSDLLGAHALGIRNILCLTGDPVRVGDQPDAKQVSEFGSIRLLKQVKAFNNNQDPISEFLPDGGTDLFPGAAADPNCKSFKGLRTRLEQKKEAGAKFIQTQMVMETKTLELFCKEVSEPIDIPVLAGIFLLKSAKNALFINKVVPGACIPDSIIRRLEEASDPSIEGIKIAAEQAKSFSEITKGIHLMAIKAEERIPEILDRACINLQQL